MKQIEYVGYGSISKLGLFACEKKIERVFVVAGKRSYESSSAKKAIEAVFRTDSIILFDDFETNPKVEDAERGIAVYGNSAADAVIAAGGGTAIDLAKMINLLAEESSPVLAYVRKEKLVAKKGGLLIAIPTTSGTGSESTCFAVVYSGKKKYSLEHDYMMPDVAIVDPALTMSMNARLTATTGLDALCQGIESLWSVRANDESMGYAEEAIRLALSHLKQAVLSQDRQSREGMSLAAHLSGKAINISRTTGPHAFSYYFTSHHGIPHGHAVALTLPQFIVYNAGVSDADVADFRGVEHVRGVMNRLYKLMGVADARAARDKFLALVQEIGLETNPASIGFSVEKETTAFLAEINLERLSNNPRRVNESTVVGLLARAL
jgi:alcohol dehydrogenase class IV